MRTGATISGGMHAALVAAVVFGLDWFDAAEPIPLSVTEVEMIRGVDLDARASTAPVVRSEGPSDLAPPAEGQDAPETPAEPQAVAADDDTPVVSQETPPEPRPGRPVIQTTPPPTPVPSEPALPSIAEIPSPDPLDRQASEPESPASTEPVMPLQTQTPPEPAAKPTPPPEVEPEPEPLEVAEAPVEETPTPEAEAQPRPDPEPAQPPEPEAEAETQLEAPEGPAPQQALLPVAKPADLAAAARAASEAERATQAPAEAEQAAQEPPRESAERPREQAEGTTGGSQTTLAQRLSRAERDALRLGIRKYFFYSGDTSDRTLEMIVRVQLRQDGSVMGQPEIREVQGGNAGSQRALFQAARRAILQAAAAGEFAVLPADKYDRWKVLNFKVSASGVGDVS